jgi:NADH-quinone oxidoreductase subunit N
VNLFDARASVPLLILGGTTVVVMLAIVVRRSHALAAGLTVAGLLATLAGLAGLGLAASPRPITPLLTMDGFAVFGVGLLVLATLAIAMLSFQYMAGYDGWREEYYVLLLLATLGAAVLVASTHFASFFLGLEILSVSLYAMIAFFPRRRLSLEAGLKYLVLAAAAASFLLFGMALLYAATGTLRFEGIAEVWQVAPEPLILPGVVLMFVGIGFKLALVPFHMWTPDIYQGAPAPVAAYVATVSKGAILLLLVRFFHLAEPALGPTLRVLLGALAVASMLVGNLLALLQQNVKRILAYSSIAHLGYLLVAFQAQGPMAASAAAFFLTAYFVTMLGAFAVVTLLSTPTHEAEMIADYRGLFWRHPGLAGTFTLMLLSLAGIPLTAGFMGKLWVLAAGTFAASWVPVIVLVAASSVGLYYYLRIIVAMYAPATDQLNPARGDVGARIALGALTIVLVWFGVYPGKLLAAVGIAMASLWR